MTDIHPTNGGSTRFDFTRDDLDRVIEQFSGDGAPRELREIALRVIRGRLDDGDDPALAEDILLQSGEHLLSRLAEMLQSDSRFTSREGKWLVINEASGVDSDHSDAPPHPQEMGVIPDLERAQVTRYAYDPETYEVLCRPGQRLNLKKAQRLLELGLYTHVVTSAE